MSLGGVPRVSIGMPVYNGEAFLREAIEVILNQTCNDFELVISDNCSTDSTWSICEEFAARDSRILLHRQPENVGAVKNFEFVLEKARAPYFMWAAYDDLRSPNMIGELADNLDRNPRAALSVCRTVKIDPTGAELGHYDLPDVAGLPVYARIRKFLAAAEKSAFFYGMYRAADLQSVWERWSKFNQAWGADFLMVLSFVLKDSIVGTSNATFYQRVTGRSQVCYAPQGLSQSVVYLRDMLSATRGIMRERDSNVKRAVGPCRTVLLFLQCAGYYSRLALSRTALGPCLMGLSARMRRK